MFQRILVPLDGSTYAEHALPVAARLARASDGYSWTKRDPTSGIGQRYRTRSRRYETTFADCAKT